MGRVRTKNAEFYIVIKEIKTGKTKTISWAPPVHCPATNIPWLDRTKYALMSFFDLMEDNKEYRDATLKRIMDLVKKEGANEKMDFYDDMTLEEWEKKYNEKKNLYDSIVSGKELKTQ